MTRASRDGDEATSVRNIVSEWLAARQYPQVMSLLSKTKPATDGRGVVYRVITSGTYTVNDTPFLAEVLAFTAQKDARSGLRNDRTLYSFDKAQLVLLDLFSKALFGERVRQEEFFESRRDILRWVAMKLETEAKTRSDADEVAALQKALGIITTARTELDARGLPPIISATTPVPTTVVAGTSPEVKFPDGVPVNERSNAGSLTEGSLTEGSGSNGAVKLAKEEESKKDANPVQSPKVRWIIGFLLMVGIFVWLRSRRGR